jgi:hypothetical protein
VEEHLLVVVVVVVLVARVILAARVLEEEEEEESTLPAHLSHPSPAAVSLLPPTSHNLAHPRLSARRPASLTNKVSPGTSCRKPKNPLVSSSKSSLDDSKPPLSSRSEQRWSKQPLNKKRHLHSSELKLSERSSLRKSMQTLSSSRSLQRSKRQLSSSNAVQEGSSSSKRRRCWETWVCHRERARRQQRLLQVPPGN